MEKVRLSEEKETLLIPLYGKARESAKRNPVLFDPKAAEIVNGVDYDFSRLKVPEKTNLMMCIRARMIDSFARGFLADGGIALHLGCGLDSRYFRINTPADWYDVDFPEVIELRKRFYDETDKYHMIGSAVTDPGWISRVPKGRRRYIVIAEGLFMYLSETEIAQLLDRLRDAIGGFALIFDAFSRLTAKYSKNHPSLKKTGAKIRFGIDDPKELEKSAGHIRFVEEKYFTGGDITALLRPIDRFVFGAANLFPAAKKAHRILIYDISG